MSCLASVHALADGAAWIWKAVQRSLTGCVQTLDFFHACAHVHKYGGTHPWRRHQGDQGRVQARSRALLVSQGWAGVCHWVGELLAVDDEKERERRRKATDRLIGYFVKHMNRLNYVERLKAGRAIGSGQVEGQAKTLGLRLKRRGARWNKCNVGPMASLICVRHTSQWAPYWAMAA